jgi:hypothetical protein
MLSWVFRFHKRNKRRNVLPDGKTRSGFGEEPNQERRNPPHYFQNPDSISTGNQPANEVGRTIESGIEGALRATAEQFACYDPLCISKNRCQDNFSSAGCFSGNIASSGALPA